MFFRYQQAFFESSVGGKNRQNTLCEYPKVDVSNADSALVEKSKEMQAGNL
jgi:hypothetical protein